MALEEYVGSIVLSVDSVEADVVSLSIDTQTGTKPVKTMNSNGRVKGFSKGITTYEIKATVVIPLTATDIAWSTLAGAKLTIKPESSGGTTTTYQDCYTLTCSEQYSVENEARRDLTLMAGNMVTE